VRHVASGAKPCPAITSRVWLEGRRLPRPDDAGGQADCSGGRQALRTCPPCPSRPCSCADVGEELRGVATLPRYRRSRRRRRGLSAAVWPGLLGPVGGDVSAQMAQGGEDALVLLAVGAQLPWPWRPRCDLQNVDRISPGPPYRVHPVDLPGNVRLSAATMRPQPHLVRSVRLCWGYAVFIRTSVGLAMRRCCARRCTADPASACGAGMALWVIVPLYQYVRRGPNGMAKSTRGRQPARLPRDEFSALHS
jgi:hypothetical protein